MRRPGGPPSPSAHRSGRSGPSRAGGQGPSRGYCESLCLYRQICRRLPFYDAFLMHASVVAVDGEAYAFAAPQRHRQDHPHPALAAAVRQPGPGSQRGQAGVPVHGRRAVCLRYPVAGQGRAGRQHHAAGAGDLLFGAEPHKQHPSAGRGRSLPAAFSTSCCSPPASRNWTGCGLCWSGCLQARRFTCCNATGSRRPRSWPMKA